MQQQLLPDDYKVNLEVFEGPLDLLLYLIRKDEIDIYDIPIDRIAEQYAEYLSLMKMLDLNMAGEFLVMAATLSLCERVAILDKGRLVHVGPAAEVVDRYLQYTASLEPIPPADQPLM